MLMLSLFSARRRLFRIAAVLLLPCIALALLSTAARPSIDTENTTATLPVAAPSLSAAGAVLMNADTGEVYCASGENTRLPMASTTKIMTALVAIEKVPLDTVVKVAKAAVGVEGSSVYLYAGEELTMRSLLYALLLESANDAAVAIAYAVAGSVPAFAAMMNERADALGLSDTHFENPHGLDHETHYTTARELAVITSAALQNADFRKIVSTYRMTIPQSSTNGVRLLINHNRLLRSYDGCIGVKTGYTKRSGRCLVTAATRDGLTLVAVTLSDPNDWRDHTALLDYGFSMYESVPLTDGFPISYTLPVFNGAKPTVTVSYANESGLPPTVCLPKTHGEITTVCELPRFLWGRVEKGEAVGCIRFFCDGELLLTLPLTADETVTEIPYKFHLFERLKAIFTRS